MINKYGKLILSLFEAHVTFGRSYFLEEWVDHTVDGNER